jgi:hypothetical protein
LLAGPAPRRPEIDDDRLIERRVDDLGHEIGRGHILDGCRGCRAATDQRFIRHAVFSGVPSTAGLPQNMAASRRNDKRCHAINVIAPSAARRQSRADFPAPADDRRRYRR